MKLKVKTKRIRGGFRFYLNDEDGTEIARARLYVIENDIHVKPFGYVEDVHVDEGRRGLGLSKLIMGALLAKAKELGLYKVILHTESDNYRAKSLYRKHFGFFIVGPTLRLDLESPD